MPPAKRRTITHAAPLLDSLEQRLDLLTRTLSAADIAEKSIDIVKERAQLTNAAPARRDDTPPETQPRIVVVWGGPPSAASGRLPRASGKAANKNCTPSMPQQG